MPHAEVPWSRTGGDVDTCCLAAWVPPALQEAAWEHQDLWHNREQLAKALGSTVHGEVKGVGLVDQIWLSLQDCDNEEQVMVAVNSDVHNNSTASDNNRLGFVLFHKIPLDG
ncbi:uncharacterized protein ACIQIH_001280 [Cyanocitta cristata]